MSVVVYKFYFNEYENCTSIFYLIILSVEWVDAKKFVEKVCRVLLNGQSFQAFVRHIEASRFRQLVFQKVHL